MKGLSLFQRRFHSGKSEIEKKKASLILKSFSILSTEYSLGMSGYTFLFLGNPSSAMLCFLGAIGTNIFFRDKLLCIEKEIERLKRLEKFN